ncbi:MAG: amidohydrolase [Rhodobacteraceae bacterium]|nr:amidohydrolase [Paracoccaceae bacterium]
MAKFKVACIQNCAGEILQDNLNRISELVSGAAKAGSELICLPEFYSVLFKNDYEYVSDQFIWEDHYVLSHAKKLAQKNNVWLLMGSIPVLDGHKTIRNRSVILSPDGAIADYYDKIHLFDVNIKDGQTYRESDYVKSGDRLVVSDLPWGKLGLTVCYDLRFSHLYRLLAQAGALFITIPSAFTYKTGEAHWEVLVRARAIESGSFVFAPSQCGVRTWGRKTFGHSLIVSPWGEILADGGSNEGFIMAEIDSLAVRKCRKMIPSLSNNKIFRASF